MCLTSAEASTPEIVKETEMTIWSSQSREWKRTTAIAHASLMLLALGCLAATGEATPSPVPPTAVAAAPSPTPTVRPKVTRQPVAGGPVLLRDDMTLRKVVRVG